MLHLKNYNVQKIVYENESKIFYSGYSTRNGKPVIIKMLKKGSAASGDISRLFYEYEITRKLSANSIMKPIGLEKAGTDFALIMESDEEIPLRSFFKGRPINIESFLDISIKLTQSLGEIHQNGIIHRNLTPDNIFINLEKNKSKLLILVMQSCIPQRIQ